MALTKRRRDHSPIPTGPSQSISNGFLTPPPSTKKPLRYSLRDDPIHNLHAPLLESVRPVKDEEVEDEPLLEEDVIVKTEDEQIRLEDLPVRMRTADLQPVEEDVETGVKNETEGNTRVTSEESLEKEPTPPIKQESVKEEIPERGSTPPIKEEPAIKAEDIDDVFRFSADWAQHNGQSIAEVSKGFLRELSEDGTIDVWPELRSAVVEWALGWSFPFGIHIGRRLEDVPIYYINRFILGYGQRAPRDDGLAVALKYHPSLVEVPGSKYRLTFGPHKGLSLGEAIEVSTKLDWEGNTSNFVEWCKKEGIPEQDGFEDLAEAIELVEHETLAIFILEKPQVVTYRTPEHEWFTNYQNLPITQVPEYHIASLKKEPGLFDTFPDLEDALRYFDLVQETCRWNWRRKSTAGMSNGKPTWSSTHMGLGPLLYPTTLYVPIKEAGSVTSWGMNWEHVEETYYTNGGKEGKKWVWKLAREITADDF